MCASIERLLIPQSWAESIVACHPWPKTNLTPRKMDACSTQAKTQSHSSRFPCHKDTIMQINSYEINDQRTATVQKNEICADFCARCCRRLLTWRRAAVTWKHSLSLLPPQSEKLPAKGFGRSGCRKRRRHSLPLTNKWNLFRTEKSFRSRKRFVAFKTVFKCDLSLVLSPTNISDEFNLKKI